MTTRTTGQPSKLDVLRQLMGTTVRLVLIKDGRPLWYSFNAKVEQPEVDLEPHDIWASVQLPLHEGEFSVHFDDEEVSIHLDLDHEEED